MCIIIIIRTRTSLGQHHLYMSILITFYFLSFDSFKITNKIKYAIQLNFHFSDTRFKQMYPKKRGIK